MAMSPRMQQILLVLLQEKEPIAVNRLAEAIGVSKRTIQRELAYADRALKDSPLEFASKTGLGVWIQGTQEEKQTLLEELSKEEAYDASNRDERRKRLMLEILKDKGLKKIFYYSSLFGVSESTIGSDLKVIEKWLSEYDLKVVRKPGSGVEIQGKEQDYRRAIRVFIDENLDTQVIRESYEKEELEEKRLQAIRSNMVTQVLNEDVLTRVVRCITAMDDRRVLNLTENSYVGLVLHISIAINRILKDAIIEEEEQKGWEQPEQDEDYHLAQFIVQELEQEFEIHIPEREVSYICLHIKGAKHINIPWQYGGKTVEIEKKELLGLVNDLIDAYDKEIAFELKQDEEFIQGLLAHLRPTFVRLRNHMKIANPVLEDIKRDYHEVFERCRKAGKVLEDCLQAPVPEEEIGFLTIHFGAALVRLEGRKESRRKVYIGVVCASGIGISRLMLTKLEKFFKDRVSLTAYGKKDITPYIVSRTDFFVTSISLDLPEAVIVEVNPLLNQQDMELIGQQVYHFERIPRPSVKQDDFTLELDQVNLLAMQIKMIIRYLEIHEISEDLTFHDVLRSIGDTMSPYADRSGIIQEDLMERERLGTQIFAEFGFALLHTRTRGVIRPCVSAWRTEPGKAFQDPAFKGISLVLVMLLPDDENRKINSEILGFLSSCLIEDIEFLELFLRGSQEEVRSAVSDCLRRFFMKQLNQIDPLS